MKRCGVAFLLLGTVLMSLTCILCMAHGQSSNQEVASAPEPVDSRESSTVTTLHEVVKSMTDLQDHLKIKEREVEAARTEDEKQKSLQDIGKLKSQLGVVRKNFESVAAGIDMNVFKSRPQTQIDWKQEFQDLVGPIIQELRSMTSRPREIEKLRNDVAYYSQQASLVRNAAQNVQKLMDTTKDQNLKNLLDDLLRNWKNQEQQVSSELAVAQYHLQEKLNEEKPLVESIQNVLRVFFKSRGTNFLIAFSIFVVAFLMLRLLRRYLYRAFPGLEASGRSFYIRLGDVLYQLFIFVWASFAALFALYLLGDWALLGLAIILLVGLAWTTKQTVPRFWEEAKLLLNLGTVKENERVVYNGLPWRVASLGYYSRLVNPELKGGTITLPLHQLTSMNSRPYHREEPWFPCREGDWVILADGTQGKVAVQTPEMVQLVLLGGSRKTYPTTEFLTQSPKNISTSFRLRVKFGIDYRHQAECTDKIPEMLKAAILEGLQAEGHTERLVSLEVEFKEAAASSLDFEILADFKGRAARHHEHLDRMLHRLAVEACNRHGWVIPFTQITLHTHNTSI